MSSPENALLVIDGLHKRYGSFVAVDSLSFQINRGEVFGFLGPNGAGKTTTMKCCTGLLRPTRGRIVVGGFDIVEQPAQAKAFLGYVQDNPLFYDKLTGAEFAAFMAGLFGVDEVAARKRLDGLFNLFDMSAEKNQLIQGYSRGMRQKTGLIAALIHQPELLVLDEPTANLDPKSARTVKDVIRSTASHGNAVFLSTHIMEIAERLCDRIAIINKGQILAIGTMEELQKLRTGKTLEDIFLELTGVSDQETQSILAELSK